MRAATMKERPSFPLMRQTDVQSIYHMQMPRWLFSDPRYAGMSLEAKLAYTFLLNRFQLSRRNGWVNDLGEVFVVFPRKELARELRICEQKVTAAFRALKELDLIWEKRCGRGDANQIYLATAGKIPEADIVFVDEIFKCNDGVLNSLLTALNERKYTNEGRTYPIPTISFFAASNEIPNFNDPQEKILEALYDRLELKVVTDNISDRAKRLAVLADKQAKRAGQIAASITLDELEQMQAEVAAIPVPDAVNELADDILCQLRKDGVPVSDRKYLNYYPIAQAKAWLSGHNQVEFQDLLALKNYLWQKPGDRPGVETVLERMCVNPMQDKVNSIRAMAVDVQAEFNAAISDTSKPNAGRKALIKLRGELLRLYDEQQKLAASAQSDGEKTLTDGLLADMEEINRKAHEAAGFTFMPLEQLAALQ